MQSLTAVDALRGLINIEVAPFKKACGSLPQIDFSLVYPLRLICPESNSVS